MRTKKWVIGMILVGTVACSDSVEEVLPSTGQELPVFQPEIAAMDNVLPLDFAEKDTLGMYIVCQEAGQAAILKSAGNYVDNLPLIYDGANWSWGETVYFPLSDSELLLYAYYPYLKEVEDVMEVPFAVAVDQREEDAFVASDFIWAKETVSKETAGEVALHFSHRMSRIVVELSPGEGMGSLQDAEVQIACVGKDALVNLQTGGIRLQPGSEDVRILPRQLADGRFEALFPPQFVGAAERLIQVSWNGKTWSWVTPVGGCTFQAGETKTFHLILEDK